MSVLVIELPSMPAKIIYSADYGDLFTFVSHSSDSCDSFDDWNFDLTSQMTYFENPSQVPPPYKTRSTFTNMDDYARYVKQHLTVRTIYPCNITGHSESPLSMGLLKFGNQFVLHELG